MVKMLITSSEVCSTEEQKINGIEIHILGAGFFAIDKLRGAVPNESALTIIRNASEVTFFRSRAVERRDGSSSTRTPSVAKFFSAAKKPLQRKESFDGYPYQEGHPCLATDRDAFENISRTCGTIRTWKFSRNSHAGVPILASARLSDWITRRRLAAGRVGTRMPQISRPPAIETGSWQIPVVSVSSNPGDHAELKQLLPKPRWKVYRSDKVRSAVRLLRALRLVPIVVCDANLFPVTWQELLAQAGLLPEPPYLIVTSRIADDRLWAEALNLGAYDVLGKPFDVTELTRSLTLAWLRTQREHASDSAGAQVTAAVA